MSNPNKDKGKCFEREVCAVFHEVYNLSFQRVPNSGSFTGGFNAKRLVGMSDSQQLINRGDIIPPDELYKLAVECKSRKEFAFHLLFSQSNLLKMGIWFPFRGSLMKNTKKQMIPDISIVLEAHGVQMSRPHQWLRILRKHIRIK